VTTVEPESRRARWLVILNDAAGTLANSTERREAETITAVALALGVTVDVRAVPGDQLTSTARAAATGGQYDAIVAGGGDGTLNAVAGGVAGTGAVFGALPLGTHNHFAKDIGVPLDLVEAVTALANGRVTDLPVGEVNGQLFLNFSAIGLHPRVVKHRDAQRVALDRTKWLAMIVATVRGLIDLRLHRVRLRIDDVDRGGRFTPSVILCNNPHQMEVFGVANASYPDRRVLNIYVARSRGRLGMLWLFCLAAFGRLEQTAQFEVLTGTTARLAVPHRTIRVSIDGEVTDMDSPLVYRIRPDLLKVLLPGAPTTTANASESQLTVEPHAQG
jgi:diacylglycerol kinase family enzyme